MKLLFLALALLIASAGAPSAVNSAAQQKDYISPIEADKIRDAETPNERIQLFLSFAEDRLKKLQYELAHPSTIKHSEILNALLNSYSGCVDDAADIIQIGKEKSQNVSKGIDLMISKTREFLAALDQISANGADRELYKENLDDAIEGTRDALNDALKAKKVVAPPPVRRKGGA